MRAMRLLPLAVIAAACAHHSAPPPEHEHTCDMAGPSYPPRPEDNQAALEREVTAMLAPDETAVLETCTPAVIKPIDDPELKQLCNALASKHAASGQDACRHACLAAGRAAVAQQLYVELAEQLGNFDHRVHATACASGASGIVDGDAARRLWACLGGAALPARIKVEVRVHDAALEEVTLSVPLMPNDAPYTFRYGKTDQGCGVEDYAVEVLPPRAW